MLRLMVILLLSTGLGACALLPEIGFLSPPLAEQPYEIKLTVSVAEDINLDVASRASPVKARIFLTEPDIDFSERELSEVFAFDGEEVNPAPLMTVMLRPNTSKVLLLSGMKSQTRLTIAAAFRQPYQTRWLASQIIEPRDSMQVQAAVTALAVEIGGAQ